MPTWGEDLASLVGVERRSYRNRMKFEHGAGLSTQDMAARNHRWATMQRQLVSSSNEWGVS